MDFELLLEVLKVVNFTCFRK